jgi:hypothetical protein
MATMRATERRKVAEEQHLAMANRHITEATERIARQSALIGRIAAAGWDTSLSERLLQEMERALLALSMCTGRRSCASSRD